MGEKPKKPRPIGEFMATRSELGDYLVSVSASAQSPSEMTTEYQEIVKEFAAQQDYELGFRRMAWLCCKAIERAAEGEKTHAA